jgi:hypothetical protein
MSMALDAPAPVRWWVNLIGVPIAYRLRPDRDGCDRCGDRRRAGYVRAEIDHWWHYLFPRVGRYCFDCMTGLDAAAEKEGK